MEFKIALLGDSKVGKTLFINRKDTFGFVGIYNISSGSPGVFSFHTYKDQKYDFKLSDTKSGIENLDVKDFLNIDAFIIMFDYTKGLKSLENIPSYIDFVKKNFPNIPFIICGNKCEKDYLFDKSFFESSESTNADEARSSFMNDVNGNQISKLDYLHDLFNQNFLNISVKNSHNYENTFLYLLRKLLNDDTINFKN